MTSVIALSHLYLYRRLVVQPGRRGRARWAVTVGLAALALSMPLCLALGRALAPSGRALFVVGFGWMGLGFLLSLSLATTDLLRLLLRAVEGPASEERRRFLGRVSAASASLVAGGLGAWGVAEALSPVVRRVRVSLRRLSPSMSGTRIVQLTDVHVGPLVQAGFVARVVAEANALAPDVVVITGDLVDGSVERLAAEVAPLAGLRARHGVYFVTGNHEAYSGVEAWVAHLRGLGIVVLRNERVRIGGDDGFDLAGVDDFRSGTHDVARALAGRDPAREVVLLAHQPKSVRDAARHGVGLQLSGHTHGGQIFPWGLLVALDQPVVEGLAAFGETQVWVSRGTGTWGPPMRVGAPPEISEITLVAG
ncbi:MAG: metallophosphoesterase [Polyangiaceae bacterium]|nr:metallophosphoesterase [Polyangiaceae bacterium]